MLWKGKNIKWIMSIVGLEDDLDLFSFYYIFLLYYIDIGKGRE